jgi:hypothetical protein
MPMKKLCIACCLLLIPGFAFAREARLTFSDYRVFYDASGTGLRANSGTIAMDGRTLLFTFTGGIDDDEAGTMTWLVRSPDWGKTWSQPERFGAEVFDSIVKAPKNEVLGLSIWGPTRKGTLISDGYHLSRGVTRVNMRQALNWRATTLLMGRREKGASSFQYTRYESGTFLGEHFVANGLMLARGRLVATIWGAAKQGENWRCGVLLSDDDGRSWRYREVGYEPDLAIRDRADTPAGFNEQMLFEMKDHRLVSIIRGREKLGRVTGSPKDTWYFRSESKDRGNTWSKPEPSGLAGTGAPSSGLTLADGSLLGVSRIPYSRTLYSLPEQDLFGMQFVRSFDGGRTWRTVKVFQHDPEGRPFDNYYNAMNGQFQKVGKDEWLYIFGQFDVKRNLHRILAVRVSAAK